jgi:hypothetical protein
MEDTDGFASRIENRLAFKNGKTMKKVPELRHCGFDDESKISRGF